MRMYARVGGLLLAVMAAFVFLFVFEAKYENKFYPNTWLGDLDLSGKTYEEALAQISRVSRELREKGFNLIFTRGGESLIVNVPLSVTGFTTDIVVEYFSFENVEAALARAYGRGREGAAIRQLAERLLSLIKEERFTVRQAVYQEAIASLLDRELEDFLLKPKNAEFAEGRERMVIEPEKFGERVDYQKVVAGMSQVIGVLKGDSLAVAVEPAVPEIRAAELEPHLEFVRALAQEVPVEIRVEPYWWRVRGAQLISWLELAEELAGDKIFAVKSKPTEDFVRENILPIIDDPPVNSRFEMKNGSLKEVVPGRAGDDIDMAKLVGGIEKEINRLYLVGDWTKMAGEKIILAAEVIKVPPRVTRETVDRYNITQLVARAVTSFRGSSPSRVSNIAAGVSKINGLLISPGEEFSAVEAIGFVNEEEGYEKEFVIKGNESVKEFGGGLCQIATTLFRLTLDAGLPVTERQNHSYVVGYYGPGLDATIYGPHPDLKFVNDTDNYLLFQGWVEGDELIMEFYGSKDVRQITISEPRLSDKIAPPDTKYILSADLPAGEIKCTERRRDGLTAEVDYRVVMPDGAAREQTFRSVYRPWQEVCLMGD